MGGRYGDQVRQDPARQKLSKRNAFLAGEEGLVAWDLALFGSDLGETTR
jgi:hypothetical protein